MPSDLVEPVFKKSWGRSIGEVSTEIFVLYATWLENASEEAMMRARVDQLLHQTESATDDFWADRFALALQEEYGVDTSVGYEAMKMPSEPDRRWTDLVRDVAVARVLEATCTPEPAF